MFLPLVRYETRLERCQPLNNLSITGLFTCIIFLNVTEQRTSGKSASTYAYVILHLLVTTTMSSRVKSSTASETSTNCFLGNFLNEIYSTVRTSTMLVYGVSE